MSKELENILRKTPTAVRDTGPSKDVSLGVVVPAAIKRAAQIKAANEGLTLRQIVLMGLKATGIDVPDAQITDRRK